MHKSVWNEIVNTHETVTCAMAAFASPHILSRRFFAGNIVINDAAQHGHRNGPAQNNGVIEAAEIICLAEFQLRGLPQAVNRCMANLIATSLTRPRAIAINLAAHGIRI